MPLTVFAENMGLFHKGSNGKGIAPADVCLTPPPPPAGPIPVPYVNFASAGDLSKGSVSVKFDGESTALEDQSECSTSTGDEPGTQGGNVITHKTKGKAFFQLWSFTVQVEGKGVCRHGDLMGQNSSSPPAGAVDMAALTSFEVTFPNRAECNSNNPYVRRNYGPTPSQTASITGQPCWVVNLTTGLPCNNPGVTADHQPPLVIAWYLGGCHSQSDFKKWARGSGAVKPQCALHSMNNPQKGMSAFTRGNPTIAETTLRIIKYLV